MKQQIITVFCAVLLTAASQIVEKIFRTDYEYDWQTNAYYKVHFKTDKNMSRSEVCEDEGATLVTVPYKQVLSRIRASTNQQPTAEEDDNASERQPPNAYSESQDVLEMRCQVTTSEGYVGTRRINLRNESFFVCKREDDNVVYISQCRTPVKGYQNIPSVGSCYRVPRVAYTWQEAAADCRAQGAHLAVINSETEALVLKNITSSVDIPDALEKAYFHIGFRASALDSTEFKTIFHENLEDAGFSVWAAGKPSSSDEHCGSFHRTEAKLNNIKCNGRYGFICEKEVFWHNH